MSQGAPTDWANFVRGVPQGSVLEPHLKIFAKHVKLIHTVRTPGDATTPGPNAVLDNYITNEFQLRQV